MPPSQLRKQRGKFPTQIFTSSDRDWSKQPSASTTQFSAPKTTRRCLITTRPLCQRSSRQKQPNQRSWLRVEHLSQSKIRSRNQTSACVTASRSTSANSRPAQSKLRKRSQILDSNGHSKTAIARTVRASLRVQKSQQLPSQMRPRSTTLRARLRLPSAISITGIEQRLQALMTTMT